jgi:serine protease Do
MFAQEEAPHVRQGSNRVIVKGGSSYLGIGVAEVDAERAKALKLQEVRGVEVKSVDPESPAAKAGLKESDVVLEYNGQRIEGTAQFIRLVRETPIDRQVKLLVWHSGGTENITATIGHRMEHFFFSNGDSDDNDFSVEIPPMPPMPPMPEVHNMPEMPSMPELPRVYAYTRTGMLGIECEPLGSQLAAFFGVKEGVLVRSVAKDSAAEKAGMRAGDVIVKVDGEAVTQVHEISSLVRAARDKRNFPVAIVRDKKEMTLTVTK